MSLPEHRRIITGNSFARTWSAAEHDPIDRPPSRRLERVADVMAAIVIGVLLALLAVQWFST